MGVKLFLSNGIVKVKTFLFGSGVAGGADASFNKELGDKDSLVKFLNDLRVTSGAEHTALMEKAVEPKLLYDASVEMMVRIKYHDMLSSELANASKALGKLDESIRLLEAGKIDKSHMQELILKVTKEHPLSQDFAKQLAELVQDYIVTSPKTGGGGVNLLNRVYTSPGEILDIGADACNKVSGAVNSASPEAVQTFTDAIQKMSEYL